MELLHMNNFINTFTDYTVNTIQPFPEMIVDG